VVFVAELRAAENRKREPQRTQRNTKKATSEIPTLSLPKGRDPYSLGKRLVIDIACWGFQDSRSSGKSSMESNPFSF
jgi:hypothetical protein